MKNLIIVMLLLLLPSCQTIKQTPIDYSINNKIVYWIEIEGAMEGMYQGNGMCLMNTTMTDCNRGDSECHYLVKPCKNLDVAKIYIKELSNVYVCQNVHMMKYKGMKYQKTIQTIKKQFECDKPINESPRT